MAAEQPMPDIEYHTMAGVEDRHWWYRTLHDLTVKTIGVHFQGKDIAIVDAGCGTGGLLARLRQEGYSHIRGVDLSATAVAICRQRGLADVHCDSILSLTQRHAKKTVDVIVSNDTLYFLTPEAQVGFIRQCAEVLRPQGILILNLPALQVFQGIHDMSVGIRQRFVPHAARQLLVVNGLRLLQERQWPFLLSPVILLVRCLQRRKLRALATPEVKSDLALPAAPVNGMLAAICALEMRLMTSPPFGSSLFLVATPDA